MKKALLVISFGTTHPDTLEKNITLLEQTLYAAYPERMHYRAFTSPTVRRRLKEKYAMDVNGVEAALERMKADGITDALVQPTLLIPGHEYTGLVKKIQELAAPIRVKIGKPLLCENCDLQQLADVLKKAYPVEDGTALVAMGHGTDHPAGKLYEALGAIMEERGMVFCTVEGIPDFRDALAQLKRSQSRSVHLVPALLVAGDHSVNDMAGEENSLRTLLEAEGYQVSYTLQGLGEIPEIRQMYLNRLHELEN